ncbi:MAG: hypothetical protein JNM27_14320 [Leptospirales bacterium]|nr:hypothetical protein [Leptospirales bacterium]
MDTGDTLVNYFTWISTYLTYGFSRTGFREGRTKGIPTIPLFPNVGHLNFSNRIRTFCLLSAFSICLPLLAQEQPTLPLTIKDSGIPRNVDQRKGTWCYQWGYNREAFTQSDINFRGPGYRFTLKEVVAKDKPEKFGTSYVDLGHFDIPQFSYRITRYMSDHFSISFGQDHMKYVMTRGQASNIYGYISPLAIQRAQLHPSIESFPYLYYFPAQYKQYEGFHLGEPINITPDLLKFDHTDGLNYVALEAGFIQQIWMSDNGAHGLSITSAIGGGPMICKSDVRLFGEGKNNNFHISGYGISARVGLKLEFVRSFFFELVAREGYADLSSILTTGRSKDRASQNFGFLEKSLYFGYTR